MRAEASELISSHNSASSASSATFNLYQTRRFPSSASSATPMTATTMLFSSLTILLIFSVPHVSAVPADDRPSRSFLDPSSVFPMLAGDLWRTSTVLNAGLPRDFDPTLIETKTVTFGPLPFMAITQGPDVYVLGGASEYTPDFMAIMTGQTVKQSINTSDIHPFIARVEVENNMKVTILNLEPRDYLNYIGGLLAHENGKIYAVATCRLFEIQPGDKFGVLQQVDLPPVYIGNNTTPEPSSTYNGVTVDPSNGHLLLKGTALATQTADGDFQDGPVFSVPVSDLNSIAVKQAIEFTLAAKQSFPFGGPRLMTTVEGNTTYLYIPGNPNSHRYIVGDTGIREDVAWSKEYLLTPNTTQAAMMVYMSKQGGVFYCDNGSAGNGVGGPMSCYGQSTIVGEPATSQPVVPSNTDKPGSSFFLNFGDPYVTGIVVGQDSMRNVLAAYNFGSNSSLTPLWTVEQKSIGGIVLVGDRGLMYSDDRVDYDNGTSSLFLVVSDLETGQVKARVPMPGTTPPMAAIVVDKDSVFFISPEYGQPNGFITRVFIKNDDTSAATGGMNSFITTAILFLPVLFSIV